MTSGGLEESLIWLAHSSIHPLGKVLSAVTSQKSLGTIGATPMMSSMSVHTWGTRASAHGTRRRGRCSQRSQHRLLTHLCLDTGVARLVAAYQRDAGLVVDVVLGEERGEVRGGVVLAAELRNRLGHSRGACNSEQWHPRQAAGSTQPCTATHSHTPEIEDRP